MRNALVATAMLLAGVATVASAQDTTRAGQQADTTIKREGQQAQADSAWKQKGVTKDSAMMHGRDSLPKGEKKAQSEQDAVNPKLDAQGRPDSAGAAGRSPTSSSIQTMEPTPSAGTPAAPRSTTSPNTELSSADRRSNLSTSEWFTELRAQAEDQKISQDPTVVPNKTMQQGQAEPQSPPSQLQEQSQAGGVNPSTSTSTGTTTSTSTSTGTTGQQQNTANAPENREGTGTGSTTGTSVTPK